MVPLLPYQGARDSLLPTGTSKELTLLETWE